MATTKKYASALQTGQEEIFFKDADAREGLASLEESMPSLASASDIRAIVTEYSPS